MRLRVLSREADLQLPETLGSSAGKHAEETELRGYPLALSRLVIIADATVRRNKI